MGAKSSCQERLGNHLERCKMKQVRAQSHLRSYLLPRNRTFSSHFVAQIGSNLSLGLRLCNEVPIDSLGLAKRRNLE